MCSDDDCPVCGLRRNLKEFARVDTPLDEVMDIIAFALEESFEVEMDSAIFKTDEETVH